MPKVSVIIPVYNTENFLRKCLDSVCNQTLQDIEIICVNDCSPDNCSQILEQYAQKDNRIRIINRNKNGGLSAARNTGMDVATGEYIYFIDSDDWIDLDYIEKMVDIAQKNKADIVLNTNILSHEEGKKTVQFAPFNTQNFVEEKFLNTRDCIWNIIWNTWAHLWKKSFLDKINAHFPENYVIEDMYFQATTLAFLDKIYVTRCSTYHYLVRNNSICGNLKAKANESVLAQIRIFNKTVDFFEEHNMLDNISFRLFQLMNIYDDDNKEFLFKELKKYFFRIEDQVEKNKNLYKKYELDMFYHILYNNKSSTTNYYKEYIFDNLRRNIYKKV